MKILNNIIRDNEGWTFVETLIVIAIALLLTAMVGLTAFNQLGTAKVVKAQTEIESAALALTTYYLDNGIYPEPQQGMAALNKKPDLGCLPENWNGPYLTREIGQDPWGRDYIYHQPGPEGHPFGILSYGADGLKGGVGENKDIQSW